VISLLPGRGPSQQLEAWLRVPGEDDVPWGAKVPVAQHHLQIKGKLGGDPEEFPGVGAGCSPIYGGEGVRVEDHQGEEMADEVFPKAWLAAKSMSNLKVVRLTLVFIDQVGAEGGVGFLSLENLFR